MGLHRVLNIHVTFTLISFLISFFFSFFLSYFYHIFLPKFTYLFLFPFIFSQHSHQSFTILHSKISYIILPFFVKDTPPPIFLYLILIILFHISVTQSNQNSNSFSLFPFIFNSLSFQKYFWFSPLYSHIHIIFIIPSLLYPILFFAVYHNFFPLIPLLYSFPFLSILSIGIVLQPVIIYSIIPVIYFSLFFSYRLIHLSFCFSFQQTFTYLSFFISLIFFL